MFSYNIFQAILNRPQRFNIIGYTPMTGKILFKIPPVMVGQFWILEIMAR